MSRKSTVNLIKFAFTPQSSHQCLLQSSSVRSIVTSPRLVHNHCQDVRDSHALLKASQERLHLVRKLLSSSSQLSSKSEEVKSKSYDRNYITESRAIDEYLLDKSDMQGLRMTVRRSANETDPPHKVYWRKDIEARAILKWGSLEKVQLEKDVRESSLDEAHFPVYKRFLIEKYRERQRRKEEKLSRANWPVRRLR